MTCLLAQRPATHSPTVTAGLKMTTRYVADRVGHGQHGKTKGEGDGEEANPERREGRGKHCRAAAAENQPKGTEKLRSDTPRHVHEFPP